MRACRWRAGLAAAVLFMGVAGCGGGDGGTPAPAQTGVSLVAGHIGGPGNLEGKGEAARWMGPTALAVDAQGQVWVGDSVTLRKVAPDGTVANLGGKAWTQWGGKEGPLSEAEFYEMRDIAVDGAGNLLLLDYWGVHRITPAGASSLLYRNESQPGMIAADAAGSVYFAVRSVLRKITPQGEVSVLAGSETESGTADGAGADARFSLLGDIAADPQGRLYAVDGTRVRRITPAGEVTTLAQGLTAPTRIAADAQGNAYVVDGAQVKKIGAGGEVTLIPLTGGAAAFSATQLPSSIAVDASGALYLGDAARHLLIKVAPGAAPVSVAGLAAESGLVDGTGAQARFSGPAELLPGEDGSVYMPLYNYVDGFKVRRISAQGVVTTQAFPRSDWGEGTRPERVFTLAGAARDAQGNYYLLSGRLYAGEGIWLGGSAIHKVSASGDMSLFVGGAGAPAGQDGVGTAAGFGENLSGMAIDAAGNLYVGDGNSVRKVTPAGAVSTLARDFIERDDAFQPRNVQRVAVDRVGNVYAACSDFTLRKITPTGVVSLLAGERDQRGYVDGAGTQARFDGSGTGMIADADGNVYLGTATTIRKITPSGGVSTVAGVPGVVGIRTGALPAALYGPGGMALRDPRTMVISSGHAVLQVSLP